MSAFGDWWISFRNTAEKDVMAILTALEPSAKAAAISAVETGVQAYAATSGTSSDKFVAARNAVEQTAAAAAPGIATDALHAAVGLIVTSPDNQSKAST